MDKLWEKVKEVIEATRRVRVALLTIYCRTDQDGHDSTGFETPLKYLVTKGKTIMMASGSDKTKEFTSLIELPKQPRGDCNIWYGRLTQRGDNGEIVGLENTDLQQEYTSFLNAFAWPAVESGPTETRISTLTKIALRRAIDLLVKIKRHLSGVTNADVVIEGRSLQLPMSTLVKAVESCFLYCMRVMSFSKPQLTTMTGIKEAALRTRLDSALTMFNVAERAVSKAEVAPTHISLTEEDIMATGEDEMLQPDNPKKAANKIRKGAVDAESPRKKRTMAKRATAAPTATMDDSDDALSSEEHEEPRQAPKRSAAAKLSAAASKRRSPRKKK